MLMARASGFASSSDEGMAPLRRCLSQRLATRRVPLRNQARHIHVDVSGDEKTDMETLDAYLQRKSREIALLESCLTTRLTLSRPTSPAEIIKQKFQLAS